LGIFGKWGIKIPPRVLNVAQQRHAYHRQTEDFYGTNVKKDPEQFGGCLTIRCMATSSNLNQELVKMPMSLVLVEWNR